MNDYTLRTTCKYCLERKDCYTSSRYAGGNYRVPGRWYQSRICFDCAAHLAARGFRDHYSVSGWDSLSLRFLVSGLYTPPIREELVMTTATHHCRTVAENEYDVIVLYRGPDYSRVQVIKAYQEHANQPGAVFGIETDALEEI